MKSKKKTKLAVFICICAIILSQYTLISYSWTGPNTFEHWESPLEILGLYHHGQMEIQPSYNDGGYNYARGWFTFRNGEEGDVTTYTKMGKNAQDSNIYTAYKKYQDVWSFDTNIPKVTYELFSTKVRFGSGFWPE